ncbi:phosphotransferase family protein [Pseudonocardia spinosispora]|uniref:phosphotransferase family protein n=1 Tax=Pseudonocardia spinosispora TaxID=103441 RepID=UPI0003FF3965|nr:phosphotransferase family protein [Pseudonocardia spinosispora]
MSAGIDAAGVSAWLAENVPSVALPVQFRLVAGGRSNLTYLLTDASGDRFALRRPPTGGVLSTAHDMGREWRFIAALEPTDVPVPRPVAFCADPEVTGAQFYLMGFVDGLVLADDDAGLRLAEPARARAGEQVVETLVRLHRVDPTAVGLGDTVRSTGYVQRQLRRWHRQVRSSGVSYLALLDEVHDLLAARVPGQSDGIVHGDFRPGNMSFGPDGTVLAVFDWELATSGDPLADLGWLVSTWQEPGDEIPGTTAGPSAVPGFPSRDDLVDHYAKLSGRDVSDLPYFVAFSRWRSACIVAGVAARYQAGVMGDDGYADEARTRAAQAEHLVEAARETLRT